MRLLPVMLVAASVGACAANPYAEHYRATHLAHAPSLAPYSGEPRLIQGASEPQDRLQMLEAGYVPLGNSVFDGTRAHKREAIAQAKSIGASVVLLYFHQAKASDAPIVYAATFWRKGRPTRFGVFLRDLKPEEKKRLGGITGLIVVAVRKGSPADRARLFPGDVIVRIGAVPLRNNSDMRVAMRRYAGRTADVDVLRDGKQIMRPVTFGATD